MMGKMFIFGVWCALAGVATVVAQPAPPAAPGKAPPKVAAKVKPAPEPAVPLLEPKAIEILKAAGSKLAAARAMSFTAEITYESPSRHGQPLAYTTISEVSVQRPDKLKVVTLGDGPASEFYYNGKQMMAFVPADQLLAIADAPPTIDAALEQAYNSAAIYFPFTDVIVADPYKDIADGLELAYYIGQSKVVGGTTTDMVGYISYGVFVQAWIGVEDKLPRMLRAIYVDDPMQLRHRLDLSNWKIDGDVTPAAFAPVNTASAKHIPFANPNPPAQPAPKPTGKAKPAASK